MVIPHTSNERITISLSDEINLYASSTQSTMSCRLGGGSLKSSVKVTGERRYSFDLPQGGMGIPAEFIYKLKKKEVIDQMKEKTLEEIKKYDKRRKKGMENSLEKKENKNKK